MAPPRRYRTEDMAKALVDARSLREAADKIGMCYASFRKRALKDPELQQLALKAIERGKRRRGVKRRETRLAQSSSSSLTGTSSGPAITENPSPFQSSNIKPA